MSVQYTLAKSDLQKIAVGAGIAIGGALLTYLSSVVANTDFGVYTPIVTAAWAVVVNVARKYITVT